MSNLEIAGVVTPSSALAILPLEQTVIREHPSIAVDNNDYIHVAWEDRRNGNWHIYYAKSTDGGTSFGWNIKVSLADVWGGHGEPSIAIDGNGHPHVVWWDGQGRVYHARSTDGLSFQSNIVWESGPPYYKVGGRPSIAIDNSNKIHVAFATWEEFNGETENWRIV
jgi:hypothetical protein